jgi:hypothetical protein
VSGFTAEEKCHLGLARALNACKDVLPIQSAAKSAGARCQGADDVVNREQAAHRARRR